MNEPETPPVATTPFADILAERDCPVDPDGMRRQGERLARRARERQPDRKERILAEMRSAGPAAA